MDELRLAGLTDNESRVYTSLVDNGPSLAGVITRKSGLHRRTVYDALDTLSKKGLVGYIVENNRRLFRASNPQRLLELIRERENALLPVVDALSERFVADKSRDETLFFRGKDGLKTVFEDQLNYPEVLVLGANKDASSVLPFYFKWYNEKRKKRNVLLRVIASSRDISTIPLSEVRFLPEKYANPLAINVYGDKTAIVLWAKNPQVILIRSKEIADGYKKYFDLMWRIARE